MTAPHLIIIGDLAYKTTITPANRHCTLGGSGFYAAIGALATGNRSFILLSSVGADFEYSELSKIGIPLDGVFSIPDSNTACFTTTFINNYGDRIFSADFGAILSPQYNQIKRYLSADIIYLAGSNPSRQLCWIDELNANKFHGLIASDVFEQYCLDNPTDSIAVLEKSDIVFLNKKEKQILNYKHHTKNKMVITKTGKDGAVLTLQNGQTYCVKPQFECDVIDTNGAGDILAAVFLTKLLSNLSGSSALQVAVDTATLSVSKENVLHILNKE